MIERQSFLNCNNIISKTLTSHSSQTKTIISKQMKTVKGEVLSTNPVSISKAASILSKFVSADTGASQAVCAYLRRASASFNELNQLHKELKSHRKHKTPNSETLIEDAELTRSFISIQHDGEETERKKHKKKKKEKRKERGWFGNIVKSGGESVEDKVSLKIEESDLCVEDVKKKHKKNWGEVANLEEDKGKLKIEEDGNVGIEDNDRKKHKKNKEENGDILVEEGGKRKKKRKIEDVEEGRERNSEESRSKKKKKRKSEVEG